MIRKALQTGLIVGLGTLCGAQASIVTFSQLSITDLIDDHVDFNLQTSTPDRNLLAINRTRNRTGSTNALDATLALDAPRAVQGATDPGENHFAATPMVSPSIFRADFLGQASIRFDADADPCDIVNDPGQCQVRADLDLVAEAVDNQVAVNNSGFGRSRAFFDIGFDVTQAGALDFQFTVAELNLIADVSGESPRQAYALVEAIIEIRQNDIPFFVWAPDGQAGGVSNGTEFNDPFSLNQRVGLNDADINISNQFYRAVTDELQVGTGYSLRYHFLTHAQIPAPASLLLLLIASPLLVRRGRQLRR